MAPSARTPTESRLGLSRSAGGHGRTPAHLADGPRPTAGVHPEGSIVGALPRTVICTSGRTASGTASADLLDDVDIGDTHPAGDAPRGTKPGGGESGRRSTARTRDDGRQPICSNRDTTSPSGPRT